MKFITFPTTEISCHQLRVPVYGGARDLDADGDPLVYIPHVNLARMDPRARKSLAVTCATDVAIVMGDLRWKIHGEFFEEYGSPDWSQAPAWGPYPQELVTRTDVWSWDPANVLVGVDGGVLGNGLELIPRGVVITEVAS